MHERCAHQSRAMLTATYILVYALMHALHISVLSESLL